MTAKKPHPARTQGQHYTYIAIAFLVSGIVFAVQENTFVLGIAFFSLALTYFILGNNESKKPPKK